MAKENMKMAWMSGPLGSDLNVSRRTISEVVVRYNDSHKKMCELLYVVYNDDFYKELGLRTFSDFVLCVIKIPLIRAQWMVTVWTGFLRLIDDGCGWLAELDWTLVVEMLSVPDSYVRDFEHLKNASFEEIHSAVNEVRNKTKEYEHEVAASTGGVIDLALEGTGVDADWMKGWLRDNEEDIRTFLGYDER